MWFANILEPNKPNHGGWGGPLICERGDLFMEVCYLSLSISRVEDVCRRLTRVPDAVTQHAGLPENAPSLSPPHHPSNPHFLAPCQAIACVHICSVQYEGIQSQHRDQQSRIRWLGTVTPPEPCCQGYKRKDNKHLLTKCIADKWQIQPPHHRLSLESCFTVRTMDVK